MLFFRDHALLGMLGSRTAKGQHVGNIIYALGLVQFSHTRVLVALGASVPGRFLVLTAHVVLRAEAPSQAHARRARSP